MFQPQWATVSNSHRPIGMDSLSMQVRTGTDDLRIWLFEASTVLPGHLP